MSAILDRPFFTASPAPQRRIEPRVVREVDSGQLLQGRSEILIRHGGEVYRLRHTRNDKLILTK